MKEIEKLIEAARGVYNAEVERIKIVSAEVRAMGSAVQYAEAMLKRAKVYDYFVPEYPEKVIPSCHIKLPFAFEGKRVRIIVIPTEADDAGK